MTMEEASGLKRIKATDFNSIFPYSKCWAKVEQVHE